LLGVHEAGLNFAALVVFGDPQPAIATPAVAAATTTKESAFLI
jgi:hypothetical protein